MIDTDSDHDPAVRPDVQLEVHRATESVTITVMIYVFRAIVSRIYVSNVPPGSPCHSLMYTVSRQFINFDLVCGHQHGERNWSLLRRTSLGRQTEDFSRPRRSICGNRTDHCIKAFGRGCESKNGISTQHEKRLRVKLSRIALSTMALRSLN